MIDDESIEESYSQFLARMGEIERKIEPTEIALTAEIAKLKLRLDRLEERLNLEPEVAVCCGRPLENGMCAYRSHHEPPWGYVLKSSLDEDF